jgi:hypothetical protein
VKVIAKEFNVSVNWLIGFNDEDKNVLVEENERLFNENNALKCKLNKIINCVESIKGGN